MHFCELQARLIFPMSEFGSTVPKKMGLNWFIPALVKSSVGSLCGTTWTGVSSSGQGGVRVEYTKRNSSTPLFHPTPVNLTPSIHIIPPPS